jgi:hypothetical protein
MPPPAIVTARATVVAARAPVTVTTVAERTVVAARPTVIARSVVAGAVVAGAVVAAGATVAPIASVSSVSEAAVVATRASISVTERPVLARRARRERHGCRGVPLGHGPAKGGAGRGHDPGGLGAHAQDPTAARGQDLEVKVVELRSEGFSREAQRLFDRLALELAVLAHQRRLPRRP